MIAFGMKCPVFEISFHVINSTFDFFGFLTNVSKHGDIVDTALTSQFKNFLVLGDNAVLREENISKDYLSGYITKLLIQS